MNYKKLSAAILVFLTLTTFIGGIWGYSFWFIQILVISIIVNLHEIPLSKKLKIILTFASLALFLYLIGYAIANHELESISPHWYTLLFPSLLGYIIANITNHIRNIKVRITVVLSTVVILVFLHSVSFIFITKAMRTFNPTPITKQNSKGDVTKYYWGTTCGSCINTMSNNDKFFSSNKAEIYLTYRNPKDSLDGILLLRENTNLDVTKMKFVTSARYNKSGHSLFPIVEIYKDGKLKYQGPYITKWCLTHEFICEILAF